MGLEKCRIIKNTKFPEKLEFWMERNKIDFIV